MLTSKSLADKTISEAIRFGIWLILYCTITFYFFNNIYKTQPTPFIDEVFHIRQAKFYCNGEFYKWDNKITTLPGLYVFTVIIYGILHPIGLVSECTVYNLRAINALLSVASFCMIYSILNLKTSSRQYKSAYLSWNAFNIATFPVLYFFNFLYYTDTLSTFCILLMFRLHLAKSFKLASFVGLLGTIVRQTNIIWVGFFLLDCLNQFQLKDAFRKHYSFHLHKLSLLVRTFWNDKKGLFFLLKQIVAYVVVCFLFISFIIWNGGIVVGDKSAHQATVHICHVFYYSLFMTVFAAPSLLPAIRPFARFCTIHFYKILLLAFLMCLIVYFNTIAHPYLLADNRHYAFYVWKNLYRSSSMIRYILVPLYIFSIFAMYTYLEKLSSFLAYFISICLLLIPQKLMEFRYFVIPFIIIRLSMKPRKRWQLALESFIFSVMNLFTLYIFMTKEFYWTDSSDVQRIIW